MIRDFWVKNYLSIRDKQELSFLAKGPASELVTEVSEGVFLYKLGILYGSNASGKSNMLIALNEIFSLLIQPQHDATKEIQGSIPFILTKDEPVEMHVSFYANNVRYDYDVSFNEKYILSEVLNYYPTKSKVTFYERTFVGDNVQADIKFGPSLKLQQKTQDSIREHTLNNHSVLSVCRKAALKEDIAPFRELHSWIMTNYHEIDGDEEKGIVEILKEAYSIPRKNKFYNTMLQKADLNILEYRPIVEDRAIPTELRERIQNENFPEKIKEALLKPTADSVAFVNHSIHGNFEIPLKWQSKGTLKYIRILDALYDMITSPHVYFLDELGEDLHNDLLFYYLNVFIFNSTKSQLIITSQETTLLSQDLINENRGVVWFVEKNKETASSEYSRGDSFGLHKNLSLYNSYRIGRLGAKPELGSIFINLED
ncbi:MAG: ATP-binding protein [Paludibacteraceae bacterium]|nr:ATP-binding protein [Paludibacteraceae bacterium]